MSPHEIPNGNTPAYSVLSIITLAFAMFAETLTIYMIFLLTRRVGHFGPEIALYSLPLAVLLPLVFGFRARKQLAISRCDLAEHSRLATVVWHLLVSVLLFAYVALIAVIGTVLPYLRSGAHS